jgi:hypothetical protein
MKPAGLFHGCTTVVLLACFSFSPAFEARAQVGQDARTAIGENILVTRDEQGQCRYRLLESDDQDEFTVVAGTPVRVVGKNMQSTMLLAEIFVLNRGTRGPDRVFLNADTAITRYNTRGAGQGRTEHHVQINCCQRIRNTPQGPRCLGRERAFAVGERVVPEHPRDDRPGRGPSGMEVNVMSTRLESMPLSTVRPPIINPGGPRMIIIDP